MKKLVCPRCDRGMHVVDGVDVCVQCGALFLSSNAQEALARVFEPAVVAVAAMGDASGTAVATVGAAECPVCVRRMRRSRVGPVDVDTCDDHGTFYDHGELALLRETLLARLEAAALARAQTTTTSSSEDVARAVLSATDRRASARSGR
ncbi:MAG: hypothetical protein Q8O67_03345 [Deltaproteobacteria bacterium]|nr:hypothetical protein [Deltaproteobacteria bacterium]